MPKKKNSFVQRKPVPPSRQVGKNFLGSQAREKFAFKTPGRPLEEAIKLALDSPTPAQIAKARVAGAKARDYFK